MRNGNFSCSVPTRNVDFGLQPASNHAASSSRDRIGVISTWSRAMGGSGGGSRDLNHDARQRAMTGGPSRRAARAEPPQKVAQGGGILVRQLRSDVALDRR